MSCYPAHPWLQRVNFKSGTTTRRSSKFKIILRLPARQCGKFMGATIAGTVVRRRDAIERVTKFAGAELPVCQRAVSQLDDARRNDNTLKRRRLLSR